MSRHGAVAMVIGVASCTFTPGVTSARDAQVNDAVDSADVRVDASLTCLERWTAGTIRFAAPVALADLNSTAMEREPFLSPDELTVWFSSDRATGVSDIYTTSRATTGSAFGPASVFAPASTSGYDSKVSMTSDELLLVFASDQSGGKGGSDIWQAARVSSSSSFGMSDESEEGLIDDGAHQLAPAISGDGLRLYFANSYGPQQLVVSSRTSTSVSFGAPSVIAELNTAGSNADPALSIDERVIVFSSTRTGAGTAGTNLWFATRSNEADTFSVPIPVVGTNTDSDENDAFLSADGCRLYFATDRSGNWDLFMASAE